MQAKVWCELSISIHAPALPQYSTIWKREWGIYAIPKEKKHKKKEPKT